MRDSSAILAVSVSDAKVEWGFMRYDMGGDTLRGRGRVIWVKKGTSRDLEFSLPHTISDHSVVSLS